MNERMHAFFLYSVWVCRQYMLYITNRHLPPSSRARMDTPRSLHRLLMQRKRSLTKNCLLLLLQLPLLVLLLVLVLVHLLRHHHHHHHHHQQQQQQQHRREQIAMTSISISTLIRPSPHSLPLTLPCPRLLLCRRRPL